MYIYSYILPSVLGLTYWRLAESELYHPLPDSFDSGTYLLQEASMNLVSYISSSGCVLLF